MTKPSYVYVTYIATTPEKLWQALIDTELMSQYWADPNAGCARVNVSDWKVGSRWEHRRADGSNIVDIAGEVVEFTPRRRMTYTWARPAEFDGESKHSRVRRRSVAGDAGPRYRQWLRALDRRRRRAGRC